MPSFNAPTCQHTKTNGTKCASPALQDQQFCYYHQQVRTVTFNYRGMYRDYRKSEFHLPPFEDLHSIQFTIREVTELSLRHKIDAKEAWLLLYALQIASSNIKRLQCEEPQPQQIVTDAKVEHAVETPEEAAEFDQMQSDEIDRIYEDEPTRGSRVNKIHACIANKPEQSDRTDRKKGPARSNAPRRVPSGTILCPQSLFDANAHDPASPAARSRPAPPVQGHRALFPAAFSG